MLVDSEGKKDVSVRSAESAVEPIPVAVVAPLDPASGGGESPGAAGAGPAPRGFHEIWQNLAKIWQKFITNSLAKFSAICKQKN